MRRRYCPAALWLAPYQAAAGEGRDFEAAGVVRALLNAGDPRRLPGPVFDCTLHFDRLPGQFCRLLERLAGQYLEHWLFLA